MTFAPSYALLTDAAELTELVGRLIAEGRPAGFDIETGYEGETREKAAVHPEENFVAGVSFTNDLTWARYVPLRHDTGANVDNALAAELFWRLLTACGHDSQPLGVAHNAKFERRTMARWFLKHLAGHPALGPEVIARRGYPLIRSCTLLESYAQGDNRTHGLKEITELNFGHKMMGILELFPDGLTAKEAKSIRFNVLDQHDPKVTSYACEDALWCLAHHLVRYPLVQGSFTYKEEMAVLREAVCEMEDTGLDYDWNRMREAAAEGKDFADKYLFELTRDFTSWLGRELPPKFNFGSPQQLQWLLFSDNEKLTAEFGPGLGLPVQRRTATGRASTNAKTALKGLADTYGTVAKFLSWKNLTKLHRDFLMSYEDKYSWAADGRAHPSLLQHGTVTGRTSAADMNYQQSPKKYKYELDDGTVFTHNFRDNIRAPRPGFRLWWQLELESQGLWQPDERADQLGWYLLGFDYAAAELRVVAGEAGETSLIEAFERGEDPHILTASLMLGIAREAIGKDSDERAVGKTFNFGLIYGMSEEGMAERLGISAEEAADLFARFWAAYPRIKAWMERTVESARKNGYVINRFDRKVRIWEYQDADNMDDAWKARSRRRAGDRTAGNAPIQGAATGDYKKISMVRAQQALRAAGLADKVLLVMDVHDALEWYVRKDVSPAEVIRVLQPAVVWPVEGWPPMEAEWHVAERWGSQVKLDVLADGTLAAERKEAELAAPGTEPGEEDDGLAPLPASVSLPGRTAPHAAESDPGPGVGVFLHDDGADGVGAVAGGGPVPVSRAPRTVYIELSRPPETSQAARFIRLVETLPGPDTVIIRVEGYPDITMTGTSCLGPQHGPQVSVIFGGALVYYALDSVDMESLASGLELLPVPPAWKLWTAGALSTSVRSSAWP